jgi:hypothetical protein
MPAMELKATIDATASRLTALMLFTAHPPFTDRLNASARYILARFWGILNAASTGVKHQSVRPRLSVQPSQPI